MSLESMWKEKLGTWVKQIQCYHPSIRFRWLWLEWSRSAIENQHGWIWSLGGDLWSKKYDTHCCQTCSWILIETFKFPKIWYSLGSGEDQCYNSGYWPSPLVSDWALDHVSQSWVDEPRRLRLEHPRCTSERGNQVPRTLDRWTMHQNSGLPKLLWSRSNHIRSHKSCIMLYLFFVFHSSNMAYMSSSWRGSSTDGNPSEPEGPTVDKDPKFENKENGGNWFVAGRSLGFWKFTQPTIEDVSFQDTELSCSKYRFRSLDGRTRWTRCGGPNNVALSSWTTLSCNWIWFTMISNYCQQHITEGAQCNGSLYRSQVVKGHIWDFHLMLFGVVLLISDFLMFEVVPTY